MQISKYVLINSQTMYFFLEKIEFAFGGFEYSAKNCLETDLK